MSEEVSRIANIVIADASIATSPAISLGGGSIGGNSQTGVYGGYSSVGLCVQGTSVLGMNSDGVLALSDDVVIFSGTTAPTSGASGTGDNFAGKGSFYIALDTGAWYQQTGAITSPTWSIIEAGNASVISSLLTGFVSGAGTVASTDTILQGFNKLSGNTQNKTVLANILTGFASGAGVVASTDTVLQGLQKCAGNTQNKALLTYTSSAGGGGGASAALTVTGLVSTDTVLSVSQKTAGGNSLPLLGWTTVADNALTVQWSADPGVGAVIVVTVLR